MAISPSSRVGKRSLSNAISFFSAVSLATLCITSCREEDRILNVDCNVPDGVTISAEFGASDSAGKQIGFLNTLQFAPGAILQLDLPTSSGSLGSGRVAYTLTTSARDYLPLHLQSWGGKTVGVSFRLQPDDEDQHLSSLLNRELQKTIEDNSAMSAWGAKRKSLRDPVGLVNADTAAVGLVSTGTETSRFVLVSAVSYGGAVSLEYAGDDGVAANTLKDDGFYFHLRYTCSALTRINSLVKASGGTVPLLFFYVPIRYDHARRLVEIDTRQTDLTKFAFHQG